MPSLLSLVSPRWFDLGYSEAEARGYYAGTNAAAPPRLDTDIVPQLDYRSPFQRIRLFRHSHGHALFLNDTIQWESREEVYLNQLMLGVPLSLLDRPQAVLILGGGFGLGAHTALQFPQVESVQVVEIDPDVVRLSQQSRCLRKLNHKSLSHPKVSIEIADAFDFLEQNERRYDLIVFDCDVSATRQRPDLTVASLVDYLHRLQTRLQPGGAFSMRIPIDEAFMEATQQLDPHQSGDELQRTAALVRQVWPHCHLAEFLSLYCGRELYVWNLPENPRIHPNLAISAGLAAAAVQHASTNSEE